MKKDKYNNKTFRKLPEYKEINWFIDVKESQLFYKKYQKKKLRKQMKKEEFNFYTKEQLKRMCNEGWCWKKERNSETVKQYLKRFDKKNKIKENLKSYSFIELKDLFL